MENNYGMQQQSYNNGNDPNFVLGIVSITVGLISLLFTLCIPWLTWVLAAAGLTCGIISWVNQKKEGKPLAMPIVGTIISGISFIVSTIAIIAFHTAINKLEQKYNEMDSTLNMMRDSLQRWDTLYTPGEYLDEPDSTFFIDY
ncbi:MAG: hypothetical protein IJ933_05655 [Bacteroidales bacterium]|nr:hypothetical protein [Bacteroidales bacterium]